MKVYENYENTEVFVDEAKLPPGGYVCKIIDVRCEEKVYGELLKIGFDIYEGDYENYYMDKFRKMKETNDKAKYQGVYYQTVKEDDLKYFKAFITTLEKSNPNFKWNPKKPDESTLKGLLFGGIFGEEEYRNDKGEIRKSVKCRYVRSVESIRAHDYTIPECKKLQDNNSFGVSEQSTENITF